MAERPGDRDDPAPGEESTPADAAGEADGAGAGSAADSTLREPPLVLVPVAVMAGQGVPETLAAFLAPADVVVLGYHVVPEQTPAEQASMQYEDRVREAAEDVAALFREAGGAAETRVAFTGDRDQTVDRVASEVGATAVLLPNPVGDVEEVLVAVRGVLDVGRLADLVATLLAAGAGRVTLWGLAARPSPSGFDAAAAEAAVATARQALLDRGFDPGRVATETTVTETPVFDIVERTEAFDVVVMGEGETGLLSLLLGDEPERVAAAAAAPVLVVRPRSVPGSE